MAEQMVGWSLPFAGCGFLGFYHVGVTQCLSEREPQLLRDAPKMLGASAWALHCATFLCGLSLECRLQNLMDFARNARKRNIGILHPSFHMSEYIRDYLNSFLPSNAHKLLSGKITISLTKLSDGENVLVSEFNSKEEVIDALVCSSFIPFYCDFIPPTFRGVVESEAASSLDQISRYYITRAKLVSKIAKYPHVEDYRRTVTEVDEKEYITLRFMISELRNEYVTLNDMILKNIEKIKQPRSSNAEMLY